MQNNESFEEYKARILKEIKELKEELLYSIKTTENKKTEVKSTSNVEENKVEKKVETRLIVHPTANLKSANNVTTTSSNKKEETNKFKYDAKMDNIIADSIEAERAIQEESLAREQEDEALHYNPYIDDSNPYVDDSNPYIDDSNPYIYTLHDD